MSTPKERAMACVPYSASSTPRLESGKSSPNWTRAMAASSPNSGQPTMCSLSTAVSCAGSTTSRCPAM
uniref:Uncharacterized protein n=1 Tax=Triticum urartu TaxID=4572 RepID=A0A8R7UPY7_TRIUA